MLFTPQHARACGIFMGFATARSLAFSALIPATTAFDRP
nr:E325 [uncultured bacterium]